MFASTLSLSNPKVEDTTNTGNAFSHVLCTIPIPPVFSERIPSLGLGTRLLLDSGVEMYRPL